MIKYNFIINLNIIVIIAGYKKTNLTEESDFAAEYLASQGAEISTCATLNAIYS